MANRAAPAGDAAALLQRAGEVRPAADHGHRVEPVHAVASLPRVCSDHPEGRPLEGSMSAAVAELPVVVLSPAADAAVVEQGAGMEVAAGDLLHLAPVIPSGATGVFESTRVPSPSCPEIVLPSKRRSRPPEARRRARCPRRGPSRRRASVTRAGSAGSGPSGGSWLWPSCPDELSPQQATEPSAKRAHAWPSPSATSTKGAHTARQQEPVRTLLHPLCPGVAGHDGAVAAAPVRGDAGDARARGAEPCRTRIRCRSGQVDAPASRRHRPHRCISSSDGGVAGAARDEAALAVAHQLPTITGDLDVGDEPSRARGGGAMARAASDGEAKARQVSGSRRRSCTVAPRARDRVGWWRSRPAGAARTRDRDEAGRGGERGEGGGRAPGC